MQLLLMWPLVLCSSLLAPLEQGNYRNNGSIGGVRWGGGCSGGGDGDGDDDDVSQSKDFHCRSLESRSGVIYRSRARVHWILIEGPR